MRILSFGYDTNLLLPEDSTNEGQYRQKRYCELLGQKRAFVILCSRAHYREQFQADRRIWAVGAIASHTGLQIISACLIGIRIARRFQPDLVEYQDPQIAGLAGWITARVSGVPLVGAVFNDFLDNPVWLQRSLRRRLFNALGKFVLRRSVRVRCDSAETTRSLNRKGFRQVQHIPFFIPWLEQFHVSNDLQEARRARWRSEPTVLCVARLAEEKNIPLLLRAFRQVLDETGRGRLVIVGSGEREAELKHRACELGIQARVLWTGFVSQTELVRNYHEANIFALASDSESSARVLIQARVASLPTITTATSGSRDIIADGKTGYVVPIGDVETFAQRLKTLFMDEVLYGQMLLVSDPALTEQYGDRSITTQLRAFYANLPTHTLARR